MKEIKFSEEELNSLRELQKNYLDTQNQFGQITITKLNLEGQLDELGRIQSETEEKFIKLQESEKELVDKLTEKYGQGTLDPKTGLFTPNEQPNESPSEKK